MRFSIIVPVFNVEKYLRQCLDSLLRQDFEDFEIILIDDGSTDSSPIICDTFAKQYKNVLVVHKRNGGLSEARNKGIQLSSGEYCVFVDSDDVLVPGSLAQISKVLDSEPDVVITQMLDSTDVSELYSHQLFQPPKKNNKKSAIRHVFKEKPHGYTSPAQQYIVKKALIDKYGLSFETGRLHEDIKWTANLIVVAQTFAYYPYNWYLRRINRSGSIMSSIKARNVIDEIEIVCGEIHSPIYDGLKARERRIVFIRLVQTLFSQFGQIKNFDDENQKTIALLLKKNRRVLFYSRTPKHICFSIFALLFGPRLAINVLGKLKR